MMEYTVFKARPIRSGSKLVPVYQVRDERGAIYCNVESETKANAFIPTLQAADKRNADAVEAERSREQNP